MLQNLYNAPLRSFWKESKDGLQDNFLGGKNEFVKNMKLIEPKCQPESITDITFNLYWKIIQVI